MSTLDEIERDLIAQRATEQATARWETFAPRRFLHADQTSLVDRGPAGVTVAEWAVAHAGRNLILVGPVGTGKTHAALAAVRPAVEAGADVRFWPTVEFLDELRPGRGDHVLQAAMGCAVLVLDDLGVERATEWVMEQLYAVVNRRWMDALPTVVTSNAPTPEELAEERMRSRLTGSGAVVVKLTGHDRRKES